jgi:hypothetical protein
VQRNWHNVPLGKILQPAPVGNKIRKKSFSMWAVTFYLRGHCHISLQIHLGHMFSNNISAKCMP